MNPGSIRLGSPQPGDELIRAYLMSRPPLYQSFDETTGIDCLTMVLRRLHAHTMIGPHGFLRFRSFQDAEKDNAIIRHSWQKFGTEPHERRDATASWRMLKPELGHHGLRADASLGDICTSVLMNKTYWSQNEMRLLEPKVCLESWQIVGENAEEIASLSLLRLDLDDSPDLTLQDAVDRSFGIFEREGKRTMHRPSRPYIIRVLYNPESQQRLFFQELRGLILPFWTETGDRNDPFDKSGTAPYVLLAVVRMRENSTNHDYARMYACHGSEIICQYEHAHFLRTDWSVEDADNNIYMLFYGAEGEAPFGETTTFPEVAPPSLDDEDIDDLLDLGKCLDEVMNETLPEREPGVTEEENSEGNIRMPGQNGIFPG